MLPTLKTPIFLYYWIIVWWVSKLFFQDEKNQSFVFSGIRLKLGRNSAETRPRKFRNTDFCLYLQRLCSGGVQSRVSSSKMLFFIISCIFSELARNSLETRPKLGRVSACSTRPSELGRNSAETRPKKSTWAIIEMGVHSAPVSPTVYYAWSFQVFQQNFR